MTQEYEVTHVPLKDILADPEFNCRGVIAPVDVVDLCNDITEHGLQNPIMLQTMEGNLYKYRIVAGHRRFMAFRVLKKETIPAFIRDDLSELNARVLNLTENLQRSDLNMMQEAYAIKRLKDLGVNREDTARLIGKSVGWVQVRYMALDLPPEIQAEVAAGLLCQQDVRDLNTIKANKEAQYEAVKWIKEAKISGKRKPNILNKSKRKLNMRRMRQKPEIYNLQDLLYDTFGGNTIGTKILGWCSGVCTDLDLYEAIKKEAEEKGISFTIPNYLREGE